MGKQPSRNIPWCVVRDHHVRRGWKGIGWGPSGLAANVCERAEKNAKQNKVCRSKGRTDLRMRNGVDSILTCEGMMVESRGTVLFVFRTFLLLGGLGGSSSIVFYDEAGYGSPVQTLA